MADFFVKLPFTIYEGLKYAKLCTIPEVIQLDPSSIKRQGKPEFINSLLQDQNGSRRTYDLPT